MALICDTGPLLAAVDRDDPHHRRCVELFERTREDLVLPALVLGELDYWCAKKGMDEAWLAFLADVEGGAYWLEPSSLEDVGRARALQQTYRDLRLGVVDATVIALAERLGEERVATLDHRHFAVVRPRHVPALTLLP